MNKKLSSQDKNLKRQNSPIDKKRRTIGQGLVLGIFESKKIKIEGLEISKRAFDKLVEFAQQNHPGCRAASSTRSSHSPGVFLASLMSI